MDPNIGLCLRFEKLPTILKYYVSSLASKMYITAIGTPRLKSKR